MLPVEDQDELSAQPDEAQARLARELGEAGVRAIDDAIRRSTKQRWQKVARVVSKALEAGRFETDDDALFDLHVRRVISLVDAGILEAQGNLRRPRWSEVRLRDQGDSR
jgi:hypothetical protein